MEKLVNLFKPGKIGKMELRNRFIMSAIGSWEPTRYGYSTDRQIAFWEARARGGAALVEFPVDHMPPETGAGYMPILSLYDEDHVPSAQRLVRAIQALGAKVAFELSHAGARTASTRIRSPHPEMIPVVAPSAIKDPCSGVTPRELNKGEIEHFIELFGEGATLGKMAGFDAVHIQGGHGYLINQFLSPLTNKRTDEYGGSIANRCRFACEIIKVVKEKLGPNIPIIFRMNGDDFIEGGIRIDEAVQQAPLFVEAGADALSVSGGGREGWHWRFASLYQPPGALVHLAAAIKKVVKIPVVTVGKIDPFLAERILQEGSADFVGMARPLMVDPELPNKVRDGKFDDIRPCIHCNVCSDRSWLTGDPRRLCAVNPAFLVEQKYIHEMEPTTSPKKVMVVGGGLAGMEAARTLSERGHKVSLYERMEKLGGQWNILSAYRPEVGNFVTFLSRGLDKAGVKVFLNREVTASMLQEIKPDTVVVATGATPVVPEVSGIHGQNVALAVDVLRGKADVGKEVVIIGGHLVGLDTALFLAERGKKVSVVEMRKIAWGVGSTLKLILMENLIKHGVFMYPDCTLHSITENGANVVWDGGDPVHRWGERNEVIFLKADTIVLAVGSKSNDKLADQLKGVMDEVYTVGDCVEPRDAFAAIHEGSAIGRRI